MKPHTIHALDGIYVKNAKGLFEPEAPVETYRYAGAILLAGAIIGWAAFVGAAYALYRAFEAIAA